MKSRQATSSEYVNIKSCQATSSHVKPLQVTSSQITSSQFTSSQLHCIKLHKVKSNYIKKYINSS